MKNLKWCYVFGLLIVSLAVAGFGTPHAEAAVKILYRKEIAAADDQSAKAAEMAQEYREKFASPYVSASNFYITDVIEPQDTRWMVALALRKVLDKHELRPTKKHGNIPM